MIPEPHAIWRKVRTGQVFSVLVFFAVAGTIGWYLKSNSDPLRPILNISLGDALLLTALSVMLTGMNGLFLKTFAAKFGIDISLSEWFGLAVITTMGNYLTPFSGGLIARAAYLKHRHAFPYAKFITLITANYLVVFWVVGMTGLLTTVVFWNSSWFFWQVVLLFVGVVIVISGLVVAQKIKIPGNNRLAKVVNTALDGWDLIKNDTLLLVKLITYSLINIILNGFLFLAAYNAAGCTVSLPAALLVSLLSGFSLLLKITPGNFGIQEAIISLSSEMVGAGAGVGLLVSLLIRAASLILIFTLGPVFSFVLTRELTGNKK
ncbi:MAG: lysylphosphatidylglycerol synthase transmembrane domain-containing protein [Syntrophales bacterium]|nr:lysylphosphatidylglycerol synthase transmembrane domain-containing protein [Syntrophales bacterium]